MSRYYDFMGKQLPSVTTITGLIDKSTALMPWACGLMGQYIGERYTEGMAPEAMHALIGDAKNHWRDVKGEAADIGTAIHDGVSSWLKNQEWVCQPQVRKVAAPLVDAIVDWLVKCDAEPIAIEKPVYNVREYYAGTEDIKLNMTHPDKVRCVTIIDLKSGKGNKIWAGYREQTTAYRHADGNEDVERCGILTVDKELAADIAEGRRDVSEGWKYHAIPDSVERDAWEAFKGLRTAWILTQAKKDVREAFKKNMGMEG